jgi:WD40 repeat protein
MTTRLPKQPAGDDTQTPPARPARTRRRRTAVILAAVLAVLAAGGIAFGVYQFLEPPSPVAAYAVAFDGRTPLAVVDAGGVLQLENVSTGRLTASLVHMDNNKYGAFSVAFSPDGRMVGLEYHDGRTGVWDTATGRSIATFPNPPADANALAFSHDGRTLAVSASDGSTYLWNIATGHQVAMLAGPAGTEFVSSVAFSSDDKTLGMTADNDGIYLWDVATRKLTATIVDGADEVAFSPDGKTLATLDLTGGDGLNLWSLATHHKIARFPASDGRGLAFSDNGAALATGDESGTANLWGIATHQQVATFTGTTAAFPAPEMTAVAFSPDGQTIAVGDIKGHVYLWKVAKLGS